MKVEEKPAYESPKISRLDYNESAIGGVDQVSCLPGSNATGDCTDNGNSAAMACIDQGNDGNDP